MDLIEIDIVEAEPLEARIERARQVKPRQADVVRAIALRATALCCHHDLVATIFDGAADDLFRLSSGIDVCRVDEIVARIEERIDDRMRLAFVAWCARRGSEIHRTEAGAGYLKAGTPESSCFHHLLLLSCFRANSACLTILSSDRPLLSIGRDMRSAWTPSSPA